MGAEDAFEFTTDSFNSSAGTKVAHVGVKTDSEHLPGFKCMGEHEELCLSVDWGADGRAGEPGVSDFTDVRMGAAVAWMTLRPGPLFEIEESG